MSNTYINIHNKNSYKKYDSDYYITSVPVVTRDVFILNCCNSSLREYIGSHFEHCVIDHIIYLQYTKIS